MGPVEYVYIVIAITFGFIGLARGYSRELGNTILIMYTVAALGFIEQRFRESVAQASTSILGLEDPAAFVALFFGVALLVMVIASYSGITFNFGGKEIDGLAGSLISFGVGLLNGYLVAGSLWYYSNLVGYPLVTVTQPLSPAAQTLLELLPQTIFPASENVPGAFYWVIPATVLMFMRVRG
jgi:hypothetical protein